MTRRFAITGDEVDAYGRMRHSIICLGRAGVVKRTKRRTHKRERREGRAEARLDG